MRGKTMENGDTRIAPNGYQYTKVNGKQVLSHHIAMEGYLGRKLKEGERVHFKDNSALGKLNFDRDNLILIQQGTGSLRRKLAKLQDQRAQIDKEILYVEDQIRSQSSQS